MPPNAPAVARSSRSNILLLGACAAAFVFLICGLFGPLRRPPLPVTALAPLDSASPSLSGSGFAENSVYPTTPHPALRGSLPLFGSWLQTDASTGRVETPWYPTAPSFNIFVAGYPNHPGNALYAEVSTGAPPYRIVPILFYDTPGESWRLTSVSLDQIPHAVKFRIVAIDGSTIGGGWLGFSPPFDIGTDTLYLLRQVFFVFLTAVAAPLFLLAPGLLLRQKRPLAWIWIPFTGLLVLALIGLLAWIAPHSLKPTWIAKAALWALLLYAAYRFRRVPLPLYTDRLERRSLLIVALLIAIGTAKATYSLGPAGELFRGTMSRTLEVGGVSDSRLSFHVIQLIAFQQKPFSDLGKTLYRSYGGWNFSHRGALVSLAAAPILLAGPEKISAAMPAGNWTVFDPEGYAAYRIVMIAIAACCLLSAFGLARSFLPGDWAFLAFLVTVSAPFTVHEVYFTWPKLEDAAFVLLAAFFVLRRRCFLAGFAAGLGYVCHPSALLAVPSLAGMAVLLPSAAPSFATKVFLWSKRLAAMAAGLLIWLAFWWLVNRRHYSQGQFLLYIRGADGPFLSLAHWLKDRFDLFCNTMIPLWVFLFHSGRPGLNAVDAPSPAIVHFNFQYWDALPFGAGLVYFFGLLRQFYVSWLRARAWLLLVFVFPLLIYTCYWGGDNTGMLRTGLHPWFLGLMIASVVVWFKFQSHARRFWIFANWALLLRAAGLLFILLVPPIAAHHALVERRFALSDIACVLVMLTAAAALCIYIFRFAETLRRLSLNGPS
jgi:hypothetical protein